MLDICQALDRGVGYFAGYVEAEAPHPGSTGTVSEVDSSVLAYVQEVLEELSASGVPAADRVARSVAQRRQRHAGTPDLASWPREETFPDVSALLNGQLPDGSWPARSDANGLAGRFVVTASRLRALAECLPAIFPNAEDDRSFRRDGYVVLDFLDAQEIDALSQAHRRIEGTSVAGFYSTWFRSLEVRAETDRSTRAVLAPKLKAFFPDYRMVFGTFMTKGCEGETAFPMHQDPSLIDERWWTPLTFWTPLVDIDVVNGCMHAVPGSHLLSSDPRPSFAQFAYPEQEEALRRQHLVPVPMRAGQLLVFHSGLIHTSPANRSETLRVAAAGVMIPEAAQLQFCRVNDSTGVVEVFAVEEDGFYLRMRQEDSLAHLCRLAQYPATRAPLDLGRLPATTDVVPPLTAVATTPDPAFAGSAAGQ